MIRLKAFRPDDCFKSNNKRRVTRDLTANDLWTERSVMLITGTWEISHWRQKRLQAGLSDCIGYWYWVYNIFVYWVFPIHVVYFVIFPIQYNTIQYYEKADLKKVKYMRERLKEMKRKRKSIPRSEGEQKKWRTWEIKGEEEDLQNVKVGEGWKEEEEEELMTD